METKYLVVVAAAQDLVDQVKINQNIFIWLLSLNNMTCNLLKVEVIIMEMVMMTVVMVMEVIMVFIYFILSIFFSSIKVIRKDCIIPAILTGNHMNQFRGGQLVIEFGRPITFSQE